MLEEERPKEDESDLEKEVHRIINEADKREEIISRLKKEKNMLRTKYKRNTIKYFIFGAAETYATSEFLLASITPIMFGNLNYSLILVGGAVVNAAITYFCLKKSVDNLKKLDEVNKKYIVY